MNKLKKSEYKRKVSKLFNNKIKQKLNNMKQSFALVLSLATMAASVRLSSQFGKIITCQDGACVLCDPREETCKDNDPVACKGHMGTGLAQTSTDSEATWYP